MKQINKNVIVVGAGPVGLLCALQLARNGIPVTVIEAEPELTIDLRAGTFHPPTLEMLDPLGVTDAMMEIGIQVPRWQSRDLEEGLIVEWDMGILANDTKYPFRLHLEQHRLTPILFKMLQSYPHAEVLFSHPLLELTQTDDEVSLLIGSQQENIHFTGKWVIGADGGKSIVRKACDIEFEGYTWPERYSVMSTTFDLAPLGYADNAYMSDPVQWVAFFRMPDVAPPGLWRMTVPVDSSISDEEVLTSQYANQVFKRALNGQLQQSIPIVHQSVYRVHQRVAQQFRKHRVLLAGDSAHVNNPLGGFGLNSGIHDAMSLTEKLAKVINDDANFEILDLYERQRKSVNLQYVQEFSINNKKQLEEKDSIKRQERFAYLRKMNSNQDLRREYLLNSSMINSIQSANRIT
jgi:3-(3-hydroxy-phenyl)propionate hydroxylase